MKSWTTNASASNYTSPTTAEIKTYLGVSSSTYDTLLAEIKYAVFHEIERLTGQNFNSSSINVTVNFDQFSRSYDLPLLPVDSITTATSYAEDDSSTALTSGTNYKAYGIAGARIGRYYLDVFTKPHELQVVYVSDGSTLPYDIKIAVLAWIKVIFNDDRDFTGQFKGTPPETSMALINKYRHEHL